jgi:hypothetical protein
MNRFTTHLVGACIALAANGMPKDGMTKRDMTMQECKDHMAMAKKDGMKKDDAMMKMDTLCSDMMKKGHAASAPMKK